MVVAGKDDRAVKAREDGKRMLQLLLFFHPSCTSSNSPNGCVIISFLGSQISKIGPEDLVYEILIEQD